MELSRQEYPALLTAVSPTQAVNLLNDRVTYIGKVNSDVANWLNERRRVEEIYVQGLKKLAGWKGQTSSYGVFQTPWQGLLNSIETLAESHDALARRIEADVERPLRDFTNKNREMQAITTMRGNLSALAKDFDEAQRKSDKIQGKGSKADTSKLSSALSGVQEAGAQWDSQAPFVFESLQALDESRVNHLRDALTQLQTHEVDLLEKSRAAAGSTLEMILNVDTAEEISAFVARNSEGSPSLQTPRRPGTANQDQSSAAGNPLTNPVPPVPGELVTPAQSTFPGHARPVNRSRTNLTNTLGSLASPASEDVRTEAVYARGYGQPDRSMPPPSAKKSSFGGGLRRLGTVMGRRNKEPPSSTKGEKPPPPERKSRNPLRRNSTISSDHQRISSANASAVELGDSSADLSNGDPPSLSRTASTDQPESRPTTQTQPQSNRDSAQNGVLLDDTQTNGTLSQSTQSLQPRQMRPPSTILEEGGPSALDEITRAQQEADASGEAAQHLKVDIRNDPISEEDSAAQNAALSNVANTLRMQAPGPAPRKQGTIRGRRDVRNTVFVPTGSTAESILAPPDASNLSTPPVGSRSSVDERPADAQSIRSAHSANSLGTGVLHRHPELTQPGLNVSIIETVSTTFTHGQASKSIMTGEIALAHNGQASTSKETVRLDNFAVLHKVAPNPQFVEQDTERSGEYSLDLTGMSKTQVGFKYQVHLEDNLLGSHSPVVLSPAWKIEAHQASVILNYTWNPALAASIERITLSNVVFVVHVENAKANSCMSKPVGTFIKERNQIYWKLGEVVLEKGASDQRVIARFSTDTGAKPGMVEARWEINNANAQGLGSNLGVSVKNGNAEIREATPDPFSDEGSNDLITGFKPVPVLRKLVSGKYQAN